MGLFNRSDSPAKPEKVREPIVPAYEPFNWKRYFQKKRYIPWWIILAIILTLTVLLAVYHEQIVKWLTPVSQKIRSLKWGWVIPILILFIISFPPLFGHEIVAILCGIVYGLWIGFAIVAAGTFLGEIGTYFAFKGFLRPRAEKTERKNLNYACLATVTREGGIFFVFVARLSAIPSHLTTAVFATCGISFWVFLIATVLSLPKQLVTVYLGVIINNPSGGHLISDIVLGITFAVTVLAAGYIYWQMRKVRPRLIAQHESLKGSMSTSYEGAGSIEMGHGGSSDEHREDLEAGSPLMYNHGYQPKHQAQIQGTTNDGRYEPFRSPREATAPGPYLAYPAEGHIDGQPPQQPHRGYGNPYNDHSANVSTVEFGSQPVQGRELV
ncbi:Tlg2-vesicle protein [Orbilia ellipsospora]|uniref:Golgi apparatus membrane protein TVP38 n=1 Tax=Orbilia ellipsospora TaxID=2528407 RepID=A0AAV9X107_9PEZI